MDNCLILFSPIITCLSIPKIYTFLTTMPATVHSLFNTRQNLHNKTYPQKNLQKADYFADTFHFLQFVKHTKSSASLHNSTPDNCFTGALLSLIKQDFHLRSLTRLTVQKNLRMMQNCAMFYNRKPQACTSGFT